MTTIGIRSSAVLGMLVLSIVLGPTAPASGQSATASGTLTTIHSDNFGGKPSAVQYYVRDGNRRTRLRLDGRQAEKATPGARVTVTGTRNDSGSVSVTSLKQRSTGAAAALSAQTKKVAVLLVNFTNNQAEPFTAAQAHEWVFTNPDSAKAYYDEESGGSLQIEGVDDPQGDVLGWFTLNRNDNPCAWEAWGAEAAEMARNEGADIDAYDSLIVSTPPVPSCEHGGISQLPGKYSHIPSTTNPNIPGLPTQVVAHELGHNFGVHHSSSIDCGSGPIPLGQSATQCDYNEYGDPFDLMGTGWLLQHNNVHKNKLGILSGTTREITGDGVYTLEPSEPGFAGDQLLRVRRGAGGPGELTFNHFYLDFRQPFGFFDAFAPTAPQATGVTIRIGADYGTALQTRLLDATPQTPLDFQDAPLPVGGTYTDAASGMKVETISTSPTGAQVSVSNLPGSVRVEGGVLKYKPLLGTAVDVTVSKASGAYTVTDQAVATLPAGVGCAATASPKTVSCPAAGVTSGEIDGNELADHISLAASVDIGFKIDVGEGSDTVTGGGGPDTIHGGPQPDAISGGGGQDAIYGEDHADNLSGGDGDDLLEGGIDADTVAGGPGLDTVSYADIRFSPVTVDLDGALRDDGRSKEKDTNQADLEGIIGTCYADKLTGNGSLNVLMGGCGADKLYGSKSASAPDVGDVLQGEAGADKVYGRLGDDFADGGGDADTVYGDKGNDTLVGGSGVNTVKGGDGNDGLVSLPGAKDTLEGGRNNDTINAEDGDGIDKINCGTDIDQAFVDALDTLQPGCESVF